MGLLQRSLTQRPERGIYLGRSARITEHKSVFQGPRRIFKINEELRNRVSLSKMYSVTLTKASSSLWAGNIQKGPIAWWWYLGPQVILGYWKRR